MSETDLALQDDSILSELSELLDATEDDGFLSSCGQSKTLGLLTDLFRAEAGGLYLASAPGEMMELRDAFGLPSSAPRQTGGGTLVDDVHQGSGILQARILDPTSGAWSGAAAEAGWRELMVYTLPGCRARLVLAYGGQVPRLPTDTVRVCIALLSAAVRRKHALDMAAISRHEAERLGALVQVGMNNLGEGFVILDDAGKIAGCNAMAVELLGYDAEEVVGLDVDAVLASRSDITSLVEGALHHQSAGEERQLTLYQRTGEPLPVNLTIAPVRRSGQTDPFGALIVFSDRRAEQIEVVESNLRHQNAQLERMMSILAHEIRNPLGGIRAGLDYLAPLLEHDSQACEDLQTIRSEISRLDRLLGDALLVSRRSEPRTTSEDITDLLDGLLGGRERLFGKSSISVKKHYHPDMARFRTLIDRVQMEQVFDNLLVNAIHAMPNGGTLYISVVPTRRSPAPHSPPRPVIEVKVGDTGTGIPPEVLERAFEPFVTTKVGGTGLGLAVARRIVGQHNGTIDVQSWLGVGTEFLVTVPAEEL